MVILGAPNGDVRTLEAATTVEKEPGSRGANTDAGLRGTESQSPNPIHPKQVTNYESNPCKARSLSHPSKEGHYHSTERYPVQNCPNVRRNIR